jgi:hypothetical protein
MNINSLDLEKLGELMAEEAFNIFRRKLLEDTAPISLIT